MVSCDKGSLVLDGAPEQILAEFQTIAHSLVPFFGKETLITATEQAVNTTEKDVEDAKGALKEMADIFASIAQTLADLGESSKED